MRLTKTEKKILRFARMRNEAYKKMKKEETESDEWWSAVTDEEYATTMLSLTKRNLREDEWIRIAEVYAGPYGRWGVKRWRTELLDV